jgi:molybdopterin-guanine dinucleotide biosynthesis protein A
MVEMAPSDELTVTILAGGRGSRLGGVDKAALDLAGRPLLEYVLSAVAPEARQVLVVANDDRLAGDPRFAVLRDPEPHAGVLPALLAGLDAATSPLLLLVACDMPFVSRPVVRHLVALAADADAVMPYVDGVAQPMHAVYRVAACRPAIRVALARGDRRMISFLDDVTTRRVEEAELSALDPKLRTFFNINTPDDLANARRIAVADQR